MMNQTPTTPIQSKQLSLFLFTQLINVLVICMFQRHLDKGGDLLEEASQVSGHSGTGLRDLARSLKNHLRGFSERLEDTRERLEDTSRCFYLLDKVSAGYQQEIKLKKCFIYFE